MSVDGNPEVRDDWKRRTGRCSECQFDWAEPDYETLVGQCVHGVAVFGEVLSRVEPSEAVEPGTLVGQPLPVAHGRRAALRYRTPLDDQRRPGVRRPELGRERRRRGSLLRRALPGGGPDRVDRRGPGLAGGSAGSSARRHDGHSEAGQIGAFDIVQRNAHEVSHHLWDVQRGLPAPATRQEHPDRNLTATAQLSKCLEQFSKNGRTTGNRGFLCTGRGVYYPERLRRRRSALGAKLARQGRILADSFYWVSGELGLVHHSPRRGDARGGPYALPFWGPRRS